MNRAIKILLTVAVVVGGASFLLYSSISEAEYYKHVDEVVADPAEWAGKTVMVHGFVKAGSIDERIVGTKTKRQFTLEYRGHEIQVRSEGPKPDTFRDQAEVVAKGSIVAENGTYVVEATSLSAKCPSKYDGATRTKDYGAGAQPAANSKDVANRGYESN